MVDIRGGDIRHVDESEYESLTERQNIRKFLSSGSINGVSVNVQPGHQTSSWAPPSDGDVRYYQMPNESDEPSKFAVAPATIDAYDWIILQGTTYNHRIRRSEITEWCERFENDDLPVGHPFLDGATISTVEAAAKSPESLPMPTLEIDAEYKVSVQEGRSRILGAIVAGRDRIPIWVAARRARK